MPSPAPHPSNLPLLSSKHIVISGAGIAGLSFALSLHKQWARILESEDSAAAAPPPPRITIFERDDKHDREGREGYSVRLRCDGDNGGGGGVGVLHELGLYDVVKGAAVLVDGEDVGVGSMVLWDKNWRLLIRADGSRTAATGDKKKGARKLRDMTIRRNALQKCLVDAVEGLPGVEIMWGSTVVGVERVAAHRQATTVITDERPNENHRHNTPSSTMTVTVTVASSNTNRHSSTPAPTSTSQKLPCDILIAADGSTSKLRQHLRPSDPLTYAGVTILSGTAKFPSPDKIPNPPGRNWGSVIPFTGTSLYTSPVTPTSTVWMLSYRSPTPRDVPSKPYSADVIDDLLTEARQRGAWAGRTFEVLVDHTDGGTVNCFNAFHRAPFTHDLERDGAVIYIGNANHAVTPFAGNGAGMALMDGWDLATGLLGGEPGLAEGVRAFERVMMPRAGRALRDSKFGIEVVHARGWRGWVCWEVLNVLGWFMR
ncbi:hypothetical protein PMZ80_009242 [Knufia obscura]|uniref:FAD-binding domain-containing protein n=1 Tax=Knufia obscura TaxID=1635080 RepID=A0ABR0RDG3_9EURO|nr:hypothetical protein PMZ80_009242 [Knufia obscura]